MSEELVVLMDGDLAGTLIREGSQLTFRYDPAYRTAPRSTPLSVSMPLASEKHANRVVTNWLTNLLPDNDQVLARWGRLFGVSPNSPFKLLQHIGRDVAGAVQLVDGEAVADLDAGGVDWLTDADLTARLAEVRSDPAAWTPDLEVGLFSLAGAQAKIALRRDDAGVRWGLPWGSEPTTHILKPYQSDLPNLVLNEHLTLRLAEQVGLLAARSDVLEIDGASVLAVERYDRLETPDGIRRVHQEDMCQSLGLPPSRKYESDRGPGIADIARLIERLKGPAGSAQDIDRFVRTQAFQWAVGGTDAHGKNYSLLLSGSTSALAPLYDAQSAVPYFTSDRRNAGRGRVSAHRAALAMRIGQHRVFSEVVRDDWARLAADIGRPDDDVIGLAEQLLLDVPDAVLAVAEREAAKRRLSPHEDEFVTRYVTEVTRHAELARNAMAGRGPRARRR